MAQRGELREKEASGGQGAAFAGRERMETGLGGRFQEKHPSPPKSAGEKVENWKQPQGLN